MAKQVSNPAECECVLECRPAFDKYTGQYCRAERKQAMTTKDAGGDAWFLGDSEGLDLDYAHVVRCGDRPVAIGVKAEDAALIVKLHNERPDLERMAALAERHLRGHEMFPSEVKDWLARYDAYKAGRP